MHDVRCGSGNFNSRPHGGRRRLLCDIDICRAFQLTPSRRATRSWGYVLEAPGDFNSRPHGGRRIARPSSYVTCPISTHALTEGDLAAQSSLAQHCIFQLTPSRRATADMEMIRPEMPFQLTPSRRATNGHSSIRAAELFQLTPSRRATVLG